MPSLPGALPVFTDKTALSDIIRAAHVNALQDEIEEIGELLVGPLERNVGLASGTDDYTAIQAVINELSAGGGGRARFGPFAYLTSQTITKPTNVELVGPARGAASISPTTAMGTTAAPGSAPVIRCKDNNRGAIRHLKVDGAYRVVSGVEWTAASPQVWVGNEMEGVEVTQIAAQTSAQGGQRGVAVTLGGYIVGTLVAGIDSSVTTLQVDEIVTPESTPFDIVLDEEILNVTARALVSGNRYSYTVTRGSSGSDAAAHSTAGATVRVWRVGTEAPCDLVNCKIRPLYQSTSAHNTIGVWSMRGGSHISGGRITQYGEAGLIVEQGGVSMGATLHFSPAVGPFSAAPYPTTILVRDCFWGPVLMDPSVTCDGINQGPHFTLKPRKNRRVNGVIARGEVIGNNFKAADGTASGDGLYPVMKCDTSASGSSIGSVSMEVEGYGDTADSASLKNWKAMVEFAGTVPDALCVKSSVRLCNAFWSGGEPTEFENCRRTVGTGSSEGSWITSGANTHPPQAIVFVDGTSTQLWTDMPAALTEFIGTTGRYRQQRDLSRARRMRLTAFIGVAGATGSELRVQYSTDGGTNWNYMDGSTGASVNIATAGSRIGSWIDLASGAKADVLLRLIGINGDGIVDPTFASVAVEYQ